MRTLEYLLQMGLILLRMYLSRCSSLWNKGFRSLQQHANRGTPSPIGQPLSINSTRRWRTCTAVRPCNCVGEACLFP